MKEKKYYTDRFKKRYHLRSNFFQGFLYLIGVGDNPYKKCVEKIRNTTPKEALQDDFRQVCNDLRNALERYKQIYHSGGIK